MTLDEVAPEARAAVAATLLCSGPGTCSSREGLRRWRVSPKELADQAGNFSSQLHGVGQEVYAEVRDRWLADPPAFRDSPVTLRDIGDFAAEVLRSDPFGTGDEVPRVDLGPGSQKKVLAITQRQLAFVAVNALMGNSVDGGDGLSKHLEMCTMPPATTTVTMTVTTTETSTKTSTTSASQARNMDELVGDGIWGRPSNASSRSAVHVRKLMQERRLSGGSTDIVFSLLSFLAVLSRELAGGRAGTFLVAATPGGYSDAWRGQLGRTLIQPEPCMKVPGWKGECELDDFMSGGVPFQAVTDIAGGVIGGGANLCAHAMSQDESLVQYYSEVLALAFFAPGMLGVPMTVMGARRYLNDITGETGLGPPHYSSCGTLAQKDWLNEDIPTKTASVPLNGHKVDVAASAFVAVASASTDAFAAGRCSVWDLVNNNCDAQRRHLDDDIARWYQVYEPAMYHEAVQPALRHIVRRAGTGPWGAGVWHGDSQQYFLATWLATSLVAGGQIALDYYIYDQFCENAGNQCFVLGAAGCQACVGGGLGRQNGVDPSRCGGENIWGFIGRLKGKPAWALYNALKNAPGPPAQLFDSLRV